MAGFSPTQEVELYKLADGDIIYFQRPPAGIMQQCLYPNVSLFMEFLHNREVVRFRSLEKPDEEDFSLELSKFSIYDVVVERVACVLNVNDPTTIRIIPHDPLSRKPKPTPIEPSGTCHLSEMLVDGTQVIKLFNQHFRHK
ncbi:ubiquitinyl hydrolase 1 [Ranunculus cassubicifolius]